MSRTRLSVAIVTLLTLAAPALPAAAQLDFGTAELGEIRTSCLFACFGGQDCDASGTINSVTVGPPFFVRGIRRGPAATDLCNNPGAASAVTLPASLQPGQALIFDVDLVATQTGFFSQPIEINGNPQLDAQATVVPANPCPLSDPNALCLQDERFTVRSHWRFSQGPRGKSTVVPGVQSDDSGLFYFQTPDNWEMLLKVIDACAPPFDRFWVFYAATTNVEFTVTVTDTQQDEVNVYTNPQGNPAPPVQDTNAFATCP